jgi:FKBP-type peptidyl-prolyl cis-trans isomerase FkpA
MLKKISLVIVAVSVLAACNSNRVEVKDGLKYQMHEDKDGKTAKLGDIITFDLIIKNDKDSILKNTYKDGTPIIVKVEQAPFKGSFEQAFTVLSKGDSSTIFVPVDSLFKGAPEIPPVFTKGTDVRFLVRMKDVQTEAEFEAARKINQQKQEGTDANIIAEYAKKNKLTGLQKTESGLNYVISNPGTGAQPVAGDSVTVKYTGKLSSGKVFESNVYTLQVGVGQVIPGWDEGLLKFKQGGKGTLLIPSKLGYGDRAQSTIPANSVLVFDVEILSVKKSK